MKKNPFLQRAIERNKRAIRDAGLYVAGVKEDGTVLVSHEPVKPQLSIVPPGPLDPRARSMSNGFVYFISDGEFIKIGFATDWRDRRYDLQIANARELVPLLVHEGGQKLEKQLHRKFASHKVRGEWFRPADDLQLYIRENMHRCVPLTPDGNRLKPTKGV